MCFFSSGDKCPNIAQHNITKDLNSYSRSKLKTNETVGPIADGDLVVYDDVGVANIINDYFS